VRVTNSKTNINTQKGIGLIGLIFGLCLIIVITSMLVNVVPLYAENFSVKSTLSSMAEDANTRALNNKEIKSRLMKRLSMSSVSNVTEQHIVINRSPESMMLQIAYEVRTSFLGNIDFVVKFNDKEEVVR